MFSFFCKAHFAQLRIHQAANKSFAVKSFALQNTQKVKEKSAIMQKHTQNERECKRGANTSAQQKQVTTTKQAKKIDLKQMIWQQAPLRYLCICVSVAVTQRSPGPGIFQRQLRCLQSARERKKRDRDPAGLGSMELCPSLGSYK